MPKAIRRHLARRVAASSRVIAGMFGDARRLPMGRADGPEPESRSRERYRRIVIGSSVAVSSRIATILSAVICVPLILHSYGSERFAIWATLNSFILLLTFSDLGLSHGLVNLLGDAQNQSDRRQAICYVSNAFALLAVIVACLSAAFAVAYPLVDWANVFHVTSPRAVEEAAPAVLIFVTLFLLNMLLSVAQNIRIAYQETGAAYGWLTAGSVLSVMALVIVVASHGSFPLAVAATYGGPVVAALLGSLTLFAHLRPWLRPHIGSLSRSTTQRLLSTGSMFLVLQASAAVAYQSDAIIIAQVRGAYAVTRYVIPFRLLAFLPTTILVAVMPFWPAFRSAILTGDVRWAAQGLRRCIVVGLAIVVPLAALLVTFAQPILELWTGQRQNPGLGLLIGLAIWAILSAVATPLWTFLVGAGALRPLAIMAVSMAAANVALSVVLVREMGISGAIYATDVCQVVLLIVPAGFYARRLLQRLPLGACLSNSNRSEMRRCRGYKNVSEGPRRAAEGLTERHVSPSTITDPRS